MKSSPTSLASQRVSPSLSRLLNAESYIKRLSILVARVRKTRYESSWGTCDFDLAATRVGNSAVVAPFSLPSLEEMGLSLSPTTPSLPANSLSAATTRAVPSINNKRSSLFAATAGSSGQPPVPASAALVKNRLFDTNRSKEKPKSDVPCRTLPPRAKDFKSPIAVKDTSCPFIHAQDEGHVKANGGMLIFRWETSNKDTVHTPISLNQARQKGPKPIAAAFKQKYTDFAVTEIPLLASRNDTPQPLPRRRADKDFSIPPVPSHVLELFGMPTTRENLFAPVDVQAQLRASASLADVNAKEPTGKAGEKRGGRRKVYIQAIVHKRRLPHAIAVRLLAAALGIKVQSISYAGIKDFIGNTVQHMRFEGVSPAQLLAANRYFERKGIRIVLSNFSYEEAPLLAGQLYGNHFKIVLRDVPQEDLDRLKANVKQVEMSGSLNYYGSQRFSFFGGKDDPIMAVIKGNWLLFAFQFLNFTNRTDLSLKELLQRPLRFPTATINQYRHAVVRRLKALKIEPTVLDRFPSVFKSPPTGYSHHPLSAMKESSAASHRATSQPQLIYAALRSAFFDVQQRDRNMMVQAASSYFWNQVLGARYNALGDAVLEGDIVSVQGTDGVLGIVTALNKHMFTIDDVVLPSFNLSDSGLPENETAAFYHAVCAKYHLSWDHKIPALKGSLQAPPRRMIVRPKDVSIEITEYPTNNDGATSTSAADARPRYNATICFTLTKGSYASVVLSDILSLHECAGMRDTLLRPRPAAEWGVGKRDSKFVRTMEDLYGGHMSDKNDLERLNDKNAHADKTDKDPHASLPISAAQEASALYSHSSDDASFREIAGWSAYHLVRNGVRKRQEAEERRAQLFEHSLGNTLQQDELHRYVGGHSVPMAPNASPRQIMKVMKRRGLGGRILNSQSSSAKKGSHQGARVRRSAMKKSYLLRPSFSLLNVDTWNFK